MDTYFGTPPSDTIDDNWTGLLECEFSLHKRQADPSDASFKFSEEDMTRWGFKDEGVLLTDNSGYMGTLNVFHELHCLVSLPYNKDLADEAETNIHVYPQGLLLRPNEPDRVPRVDESTTHQ